MSRKLSDLKIDAYLLEELPRGDFGQVTLCYTPGRHGGMWRIQRHPNEALGKTPDSTGHFFFEDGGLPSSRDEAFYQEYRFATAEEGLEFWEKNRPNILATMQETRDYWAKHPGDTE